MDMHTLPHRCIGNAQSIVERVQMQGCRFKQGIVIAGTVYPLLYLCCVEPLPMAVEVFCQQTLARRQHLAITKPVDPQHPGIHRIAGDGVLRHTLADQRHRIGGAAVQGFGAYRPQVGKQAILTTAEASKHEAAIAPGSAKAGRLRIEHQYIAYAAFCQPQCGIQAGETGTDNAHSCFMLARQRRKRAAVRAVAVVSRVGTHTQESRTPSSLNADSIALRAA
jgi:hypothetical protein